MKLNIKSFIILATVLVSPLAQAQSKDIIDTAVSAGGFNTLAALNAAGLVEAHKGKEPFTVSRPRDEAFAKSPKGTPH
ncbi:MAG: putative surface protein with fasciclin (FAS1) repeats [Cryomorphaceae bacterium]|jgi:uncharacterized surface protein with fasciclin (FAS1) repeats